MKRVKITYYTEYIYTRVMMMVS